LRRSCANAIDSKRKNDGGEKKGGESDRSHPPCFAPAAPGRNFQWQGRGTRFRPQEREIRFLKDSDQARGLKKEVPDPCIEPDTVDRGKGEKIASLFKNQGEKNAINRKGKGGAFRHPA